MMNFKQWTESLNMQNLKDAATTEYKLAELANTGRTQSKNSTQAMEIAKHAEAHGVDVEVKRNNYTKHYVIEVEITEG